MGTRLSEFFNKEPKYKKKIGGRGEEGGYIT